jgi:hypothetical protein
VPSTKTIADPSTVATSVHRPVAREDLAVMMPRNLIATVVVSCQLSVNYSLGLVADHCEIGQKEVHRQPTTDNRQPLTTDNPMATQLLADACGATRAQASRYSGFGRRTQS